MNKVILLKGFAFAAAAAFVATGCGRKEEAHLDVRMSDKFDGSLIELVSFGDSTVLMSDTLRGGHAAFGFAAGEAPRLVQVMVDGRVRAFYIAEPGMAQITDSVSVARGTDGNERFFSCMQRLDSVENLDDIEAYVDYAEKLYNENRDNVSGAYFGVEWLKYAGPERVDSFMRSVPEDFASSWRVRKAVKAAQLREATSPGHKYVDFAAEDAGGRQLKLSSLIKPGKWTLVDFWASWCPYCIKELPAMKELQAKYSDRGLEIVGVAVRDKAEDTARSVEKHSISWPTLYNAKRLPYDIYGFSGIPHHILLDPDGVIVSRGESVSQIDSRLEKLLRQ